jgi:tRNA(adenine34) deaminase
MKRDIDYDQRIAELAPSRTFDGACMLVALEEARDGANGGEVPVGAIVLIENHVVGAAHNRPIGLKDPSAHAEILAIREAATNAGAYRLGGASIYVTLESCVMCVGAIINARIAKVYYGARDEKAGALGSVYDIGRDGRLNHRIEVHAGILADECAALLREFFRERRER